MARSAVLSAERQGDFRAPSPGATVPRAKPERRTRSQNPLTPVVTGFVCGGGSFGCGGWRSRLRRWRRGFWSQFCGSGFWRLDVGVGTGTGSAWTGPFRGQRGRVRQKNRHVLDPEFGRSDIFFRRDLQRTRGNGSFRNDRHERSLGAAIAHQRGDIPDQLAFKPAGRATPGSSNVMTQLVAGTLHRWLSLGTKSNEGK